MRRPRVRDPDETQQAFSPNDETQSAFGQALREAARAGVALYAYDCQVTPDHLSIDAPVPIEL